MKKLGRHLRATRRLLIGAALSPFALAAVAVQGAVVGPVFKNYTTIPNMIYAGVRKILGLKVEFNKASAPLEKKRPTWFVANHMSMADPIALGGVLEGTFAGKGDILRWPVISQMARAVQYIGIRRVTKDDPNFKTLHRQTMGEIMQNFNKGFNTIMFPEGTITDGKEVAQFRAGLISMLYGGEGLDEDENPVRLEKEVVVQPIAARVKEVEGKNAIGDDKLRYIYSRHDQDNTLTRVWNRLCTKEIVIELTAFEPLETKDFKDQFALINHAHELVRGVVAPHQTEVKPAKIPGVDDGPKV